MITIVWENNLKGSFLYRFYNVLWNILPCRDSMFKYRSDGALTNIDNIAASYTSSFLHPYGIQSFGGFTINIINVVAPVKIVPNFYSK